MEFLAKIARRKYGQRPNEHKKSLSRLFHCLEGVVKKKASIKTDEHQNYSEFVHKFFPHGNYQRYKGAMLKADINRIIRKTWCTTKDPGRLQKHLHIYIDFHTIILAKHS